MRALLQLAGLLASAACLTAQIPIPPHFSVYNGYSRGFNFTAQRPFFIVSLDLPLDAFQAGDTANYLVRVNGTVVLRSVANPTSLVPTNIPINNGDVVDIIGNWSPAVPGSFTAHNSYGTSVAGSGAAPYATVIEGVAHTLNRCGWQWDIADPAYTTAAYLAPTTGSIGRVLVGTSATGGGGGGGTFATNSTYGQGCYNSYASFYELFATASNFDLGNSSFSMVPTGAGYTVLPGLSQYIPPSATATVLALTDDSEAPVTLTSPFPYSGGTTLSLFVCSNGFVSVASGNGTLYTPAAAAFLSAPQTGWWVWHDLNPAAAGSGSVKFEEVGNLACVTFDGVYNFGGTTAVAANTFQFQFDKASGIVHMAFQAMSGSGNAYLVGYSPGGSSLDPGNADLSAAIPATIAASGTDVPALAFAASARPVTGTSINLNTSNIPAGSAVGATMLGFVGINPGVDLGFAGAPGCFQYLNPAVSLVYFATGSSFSQPLAIPANSSFAGLVLYGQSVSFGTTRNLLGALFSNGVSLTVGTF